jgi:putative addiction module component (TIGR02574 family)
MKADLDEILRQAMTLSPEQRAALAGSLLESLDEEVDEDSEVAWKAEIRHRIQEVESGAVTPISVEEFERRISKRLNAL